MLPVVAVVATPTTPSVPVVAVVQVVCYIAQACIFRQAKPSPSVLVVQVRRMAAIRLLVRCWLLLVAALVVTARTERKPGMTVALAAAAAVKLAPVVLARLGKGTPGVSGLQVLVAAEVAAEVLVLLVATHRAVRHPATAAMVSRYGASPLQAVVAVLVVPRLALVVAVLVAMVREDQATGRTRFRTPGQAAAVRTGLTVLVVLAPLVSSSSGTYHQNHQNQQTRYLPSASASIRSPSNAIVRYR